ncbi:MAG: NAD(P)H-dependent oxidoreductase [Bacteriovoracaceae bacterium]|nr:NAD(P)H-dependent oxidoreductase [Bacteriovoracaceae bacterium]
MILIINAHPSRNSFTSAIANSYATGAREAGAKVELLNLYDLKFDPILHDAYHKIMPLEEDLIRAQKLIKACKHLVICYPQWWGSGPALLKGFIDRTFLPGFAFHYRNNSSRWDKLLSGRSAELWLLSDSPKLWFFIMYWNSPIKWLKTATLQFCGFNPVKVNIIDRVRFLTLPQREKALERARKSSFLAAKKL